ncbi:MAG: leucine-rich repeat protein [Clostridia bacterium]|nr:leucine-rich repeat protein [Clostridia bacterium]
MAYFKDTMMKNSLGAEVLGEIDYFDNPCGCAVVGSRFEEGVLVTEDYTNEGLNGLTMIRSRTGLCVLTHYFYGKANGPCMVFGDGTLQLSLKVNDVDNGPVLLIKSPSEFIIGNFECGNFTGETIVCSNGYMWFDKRDEFDKSKQPKALFSASELKFYATHLKMQPYYYRNSIYTNGDSEYRIARQGITDDAVNKSCYGYIRWAKGDFCISEFKDKKRTGIGCYRYANGDEYLGEFYEAACTGIGVRSLLSKGVIELGNFNKKKKEGTFFEISEDSIWICRYEKDFRVGEAFRISRSTFNITKYNGSLKEIETKNFNDYFSTFSNMPKYDFSSIPQVKNEVNRVATKQQVEKHSTQKSAPITPLKPVSAVKTATQNVTKRTTKKHSLPKKTEQNDQASSSQLEVISSLSDFNIKEEGEEKILMYPLKQADEIIVPEGVTKIFGAAFCFPKPVTAKKIKLPSTVKEIAVGAFSGCKNLTVIDISKTKIKEIRIATFSRVSITDIYLPKSVRLIELGAFSECKKLKYVYLSRKCDVQPNAFPSGVQFIYLD